MYSTFYFEDIHPDKSALYRNDLLSINLGIKHIFWMHFSEYQFCVVEMNVCLLYMHLEMT